MKTCPVGELLSRLRAGVRSLPERNDAHREARARALVVKLPLVHRTVTADRPGRWQEILRSKRIQAKKPSTTREERLGSTRAAYFFLGHPAWPQGLVAILLPPHADLLDHATFTPFDSGGLEKHMVPIDPTAPSLDDAGKDALLASHVGPGADLHEVAGPFIATHVREPERYVSYARYQEPDWPIFHGYRSPSGDRRSWTIEVQAHEDVSIDPPEERLDGLIVAGKSVGLRLDDDIFDLCTEVETEDDVAQGVINHVLTRAMEPGS